MPGRLARSTKRAVLPLVVAVGVVGILVTPLYRDPMTPLVAAIAVAVLLLVSAVSLSRRDPVTVLTLMLVVLFLVPGDYVLSGPLKSVGNPAQLVGLLALLLWGASRVLGLLPARPGNPVRWLLFGWVLVTLASFAAAMTRVISADEDAGAVRTLWPFAAFVGVALLALDGLRTRELVDRMLFRLTVMGGISALIGIAEFVLHIEYRTLAQLPGLARNIEEYTDTRGHFTRVQGGAVQAIEYAVTIATIAPIALNVAMTATNRTRRTVGWCAFIAILLATPMTLTRSGLLCLTVVLTIYGVHLSRRARANAVIFAVLGLAAFRVAVPGVLGTLQYFVFAGSSDSSITARTQDYAHIPGLIRGHELLGRGVGTFVPKEYFVLDNQYLLTYLQQGLLGLGLLIVTYVVGMGVARGYRKRSSDPSARGVGQALAASIAALGIASATFDEFSFRQAYFCLGLLLGVSGALWSMARSEEAAAAAAVPADDLATVG